MTKKKSSSEKRTALPRDAKKTSDFVKDWARLSRSGKHDMNGVKEVMLLLIANDAPLPAELRFLMSVLIRKFSGNPQAVRKKYPLRP